MTKSLEQLRRDAKALKAAYAAGDRAAYVAINNWRPRPEGVALKHADFLHVIARDNGFASWPHLKLAAETHGMDRATRQQRLGQAIKTGQFWMVDILLGDDPDLARSTIGLACCFYDQSAVAAFLAADPGAATRPAPIAPPLIQLAQSHAIHHMPERADDMIAIAEMLVAGGADVNAGLPAYEGAEHQLSTLYFALGHAGNLPLAEWLLKAGADPNDNESLYHATELGQRAAVKLLLDHGARPDGTNALLRALDFRDVETVEMLLAHGADPNAFDGREIGGEAPWVIPALHQAARRHAPMAMVEALLTAGADPNLRHQGATPYGFAKVFGHGELATRLAAVGADTELSPVEAVLARIAEDRAGPEDRSRDADLPEPYAHLIRQILHLPGTLGHVHRLVAAGLDPDRPDGEGLTPVQVAGWEGLPEVMGWFLTQNPDLDHINDYGGTLLSTIVHGAENAPDRATRDHAACVILALEAGVAIPRAAPDRVAVSEIAEILRDWAEAHPAQVVAHGVI